MYMNERNEWTACVYKCGDKWDGEKERQRSRWERKMKGEGK